MFLPPLEQPYSPVLAAIDAGTWTGASSITTLGTVATGVWNATAIGATKGGTGLTSYTLGDLLYSSAANTLAKLAGNTTTTPKALLQTGDGSNSAAPAWTAVPTSITGTSNQVIASASTGAVTLSLPQSIATSSMFQAGNLGVGIAPLASRGVRVTATPSGAGVSHLGLALTCTPPVNDGTFVAGVYGVCSTPGTGGGQTYADVRGCNIGATTPGAGDTITVGYGIKVESQAAAGTNWGIYTDGGNNRFGDDVLIGTTTAPTTNSGASLMLGASAGAVTPGVATAGIFAKTVTQVELFVVDSAATATQVSPHPDDVMESRADRCASLDLEPVLVPWGYQSENLAAGVQVTVDLALLTRLVERLATEHYGRPVTLLKTDRTTPSVDWNERDAAALTDWQRQADLYDFKLRRHLARPFWLRTDEGRPDTLVPQPRLTPPPTWLAALLSL